MPGTNAENCANHLSREKSEYSEVVLTALFSRIVTVCLQTALYMYIIAIAWLYVVFMMSITEQTAVSGVMTFLLYGLLPLTIVLYLMDTPRRKRNRQMAEKNKAALLSVDAAAPSDGKAAEGDANFIESDETKR